MIKKAMKSYWLLVLPVFLLSVTRTPAQEKDAQLWASIMLKYNLTEKVQLRVEEELRYFENISRLDKSNTEFTLLYRLNGFLEAGSFYRLISNRDAEGYFNLNHRFAFFGEIKRSAGSTFFRAKPMIQFTWPAFYRSENWQIPEKYIRLEAGLTHELPNNKTELFSDIEFWYSILAGEPDFIDKYRFTAGISQKMDRKNRLRFFYRLQQEIQVADPLTSHIIGIGYTYWIR